MPRPTLNIDTQFPSFDNRAMFDLLLENVPGAQDMSWQYDTSPCIHAPGAEIWVDFAFLERRESSASRTFTICQYDEWGMETGVVLETDLVDEAIRFAKAFTPQPRQLNLFGEGNRSTPTAYFIDRGDLVYLQEVYRRPY